ncbi:hypothetical protein FIBSPDRAFT_877318, partial [Athelia psychrophila]
MHLDALPRQRCRDIRSEVRVVECTGRDAGGGGKVLYAMGASARVNPGSNNEVEMTAASSASCRPCTPNPPTRGLNTSVPVLITPLNSRSTRVVLHFPSSQSACATTRATIVLSAFVPSSSFPTL